MAGIWGVGVDVVDLARFERSLERTPGLRERLFTPVEAAVGSIERLAARFAAKEAFVKALRAPTGLSWHDVEVVLDEHGAPALALSDAAAAHLHSVGVERVHVSLSHDTSVATAFVVAEA